jgi:hypothetical protein
MGYRLELLQLSAVATYRERWPLSFVQRPAVVASFEQGRERQKVLGSLCLSPIFLSDSE